MRRNLILSEPAGTADAREELPAGGVLHDDGEVGRRQDDLGKKRVSFFFTDIGRRAEERRRSPPSVTSLNWMMLGWRSVRWLMISRCTFSSICREKKTQHAAHMDEHAARRTDEKAAAAAAALEKLAVAGYLLAALDVLDGDEGTGGAGAHEARHAEVAGPDFPHVLVPVPVVHYRQRRQPRHLCRRPRPCRRCRPVHRQLPLPGYPAAGEQTPSSSGDPADSSPPLLPLLCRSRLFFFPAIFSHF